MRKIGGHVSAAGGLEKAIDRAVEIGANCLQLFSGSPRVWAKRPLSQIDFNEVCSKYEECNVKPIFTHSLYLVNLASDSEYLAKKSLTSLQYELEFDAAIKGSGVIVHIGSHQGRGWEASQLEVAERIDQLLQSTPANSTLLIENSAGQKGKLHSKLEDIAWTFEHLSKYVEQGRLGWCVDTCHAHAAGYTLPALATKITDLDLWSKLRCVHVNDSKDAFGSGRDRHENIGDGQIPLTDLKQFLNLKQVQNIPLITEVPGLDGKGPDKANIDRIKQLVTV